jgi:hypothetical protein
MVLTWNNHNSKVNGIVVFKTCQLDFSHSKEHKFGTNTQKNYKINRIGKCKQFKIFFDNITQMVDGIIT